MLIGRLAETPGSPIGRDNCKPVSGVIQHYCDPLLRGRSRSEAELEFAVEAGPFQLQQDAARFPLDSQR